MKSTLLVLVAAPCEGDHPKPRMPLGRTLLGKSLLELALDSSASLRPWMICVDADESLDGFLESIPPPLRCLVRCEDFSGAPEGICSLKRLLVGRKRGDVLVLSPRFPLLGFRSLKSLCGRHRRQGNALTVVRADREYPAWICKMDQFIEAMADARRRRKYVSLTDILELAGKRAGKTGAYLPPRPEEIYALRRQADVAGALQILRSRKLHDLQSRGVVILDPLSTWIDLNVRIGRDTVLYPSVVIEGRSSLGRQCRIYPFVHLVETRVGDRVKILSSTMVEKSTIQDDAQVGPFTHFRPNTLVRRRAKVGNFVEMKNTIFGERSKANHLSYIGDSVVGEEVNIGAGTITCNYDGIKKYQTIIEKGAFIGSGVELVAPVKVGRSSYIGAGSTITKNVSPEALAVARSRQVEKPGWARRRMKK